MCCCNLQVQIILRSGDTGPYSDPIVHTVRGTEDFIMAYIRIQPYLYSLHERKRVPPLQVKLYRAYQSTNLLPTSYHKHLYLA